MSNLSHRRSPPEKPKKLCKNGDGSLALADSDLCKSCKHYADDAKRRVGKDPRKPAPKKK